MEQVILCQMCYSPVKYDICVQDGKEYYIIELCENCTERFNYENNSLVS
jgi:hypothetical protein